MIWRVVTSDVTRGQSYYEICEFWSLDDLDDANCVIDAHEEAHARAAATQRKSGR